MTVPLARSVAWALNQAATFPDTLLVKQVSEPRSWFDTVSGVAGIVISVALVTLTVGLLPAAWNFRKSYKKVNELLDRIYGDVNPIMRHASSIADNVNYVSTAVRQDVARLQATVAAANARLDEATRLTERRVHEFNALLEVAQAEAENTFVATAASLRGLREGAATFREDALDAVRGRRPAHRDDFTGDDAVNGGGSPSSYTQASRSTTTLSEETEHGRIREKPSAEDDELEGKRPRVRPRDGGGRDPGRPT
ncbi:MAG TPA: DUF948 domain-containing protein [Gemmatimonadaceae bacterium]|nr:DUF948 domain-containing protein [Gemmatimonadaceae bacterium]